jgi:hypothetical protein
MLLFVFLPNLDAIRNKLKRGQTIFLRFCRLPHLGWSEVLLYDRDITNLYISVNSTSVHIERDNRQIYVHKINLGKFFAADRLLYMTVWETCRQEVGCIQTDPET